MCACGARVTVVFLCVCVCVHSASSVTHATKQQTKHTGGLSIIVAPELIWHFFCIMWSYSFVFTPLAFVSSVHMRVYNIYFL